MAVIHDVMPPFELLQPTSVDDAAAMLAERGAEAWVLAGGMDTFEWLKERTKRPAALVDLNGIAELRGIRPWEDGLEIGAMTTLSAVAADPTVRQRYGLLMEAADLVASPQIRNQGTLGGNISQDTRCWYYRAGWSCYRAGGNICYADTPTAINREHAIFDADRCVAVSPSDTAPALVALDAQMVIRRGHQERVVAAAEFFVGPGVDIERMTVLEPGDLLTAIRLPGTWAEAQFYFEKVRDREVWDFPLVNVASAIRPAGDRIEEMRLVVGAVACQPRRLTSVETAVAGEPINEATAERAGQLAVEGALPLQYNGYKIPLMRNLVKRAIRGATPWTS